MDNIDASRWIGNAALGLIENQDETGTGFSHFRLRFSQTRPGQSEDALAQAASE
jgi:hypothetical protein